MSSLRDGNLRVVQLPFALPDDKENPEIASFHLNADVVLPKNTQNTFKFITWSKLEQDKHTIHANWRRWLAVDSGMYYRRQRTVQSLSGI